MHEQCHCRSMRNANIQDEVHLQTQYPKLLPSPPPPHLANFFSHDCKDPSLSSGSPLSHPPPQMNPQVPVGTTTSAMARISNTSSMREIPGTQTPSETQHRIVSCASPISRLPPDVLIIVFELVASSRTREDLYALLSLTRVCQVWRISLIGYPRAWTTIFATHRDRRSFVEACLERSGDQLLEVTVDINDKLRVPKGCSCKNDGWGKLLPNQQSPCEWHFSFELLAQPSVAERITLLRISSSSQVLTPPSISRSFTESSWFHFSSLYFHPSFSASAFQYSSWTPKLELTKCQFFLSTFQRLTTLVWDDEATKYARLFFSAPDALPELKSVTFEGRWHESLSLSRVANLTSFTIKRYLYTLNAEEFRLFLSNNTSLVSLEASIDIRGHTEGDPVVLPNLKSLSVDCDPEALSTILQVPAFQRLSTIWVSTKDGRDDLYTIHATGEEVSLSAEAKALKVQDGWRSLTGHAKPTIHRVRVHDTHPEIFPSRDSWKEFTPLMADARTVDLGLTYLAVWEDGLWDELKQLRELRVIRFEILEEMNPFGEPCDPDEDLGDLNLLWDKIADLAEQRFRNGQPLQAVERIVVSEDEEIDRLQDVLWERFLEGRGVRNYFAPEKGVAGGPST